MMNINLIEFLEVLVMVLLVITCGWLWVSNSRLKQTISRLTTLDEVSGLKNREAILEQLEVSYLTAKRYKQSMTVALLKLKELESLHEQQGNKAIDQCVKEVSNLLEAELRTTDLLGRVHDDTFLIVLTHTHSHNSRAVFERLVTTLNSDILTEGSVTGTMGCSNLHEKTANVAMLVKEAEFALRQAVNQGNKVQYFGL